MSNTQHAECLGGVQQTVGEMSGNFTLSGEWSPCRRAITAKCETVSRIDLCFCAKVQPNPYSSFGGDGSQTDRQTQYVPHYRWGDMITINLFETAALDVNERLAEMKRILTEELPADNYFVLKFIVHFLTEVVFFIVHLFLLITRLSCSCNYTSSKQVSKRLDVSVSTCTTLAVHSAAHPV